MRIVNKPVSNLYNKILEEDHRGSNNESKVAILAVTKNYIDGIKNHSDSDVNKKLNEYKACILDNSANISGDRFTKSLFRIFLAKLL